MKKYQRDETPDYENERIFQWENEIWYKINSTPITFFVQNSGIPKSYKQLIKCKENKNGDYVCSRGNTTDYGYFVFDKIAEYTPVHEGMESQFIFSGKNQLRTRIKYGEASLEEIGRQVKNDGIIFSHKDITDVLSLNKGLLDYLGNSHYLRKKAPPRPGFFYIDKKIVSDKTWTKPSKTEVKKALELLHEFAKYFPENADNLGFILRWELIAPFNFCYKQSGSSEVFGAIYIWGKPNTGKSTAGTLIAHIWDRRIEDVQYSSASADTPYRFGEMISQTTYPVLLEEGSTIFSNRDKSDDIFDMFKTSVTMQIGRTVGRLTGEKLHIPAYSPCFMTSNKAPASGADIGRRMHTFEWTMKTLPTEQQIEEFITKFELLNNEGPMNVLKAIGEFAAVYMMENPMLLFDKWEFVADLIWEEIYDYVGIYEPDWMWNYAKPAGLYEAMDLENEQLYTQTKQLILRRAMPVQEFGPPPVGDPNGRGKRLATTVEDKLRDVVTNGREPWIEFRKPKTGINVGKKFVLITGGIREAMKREFGVDYDLKRIAEECNGEYTKVRTNNKEIRVIRWPYDDFIEAFS